ncbi:MAG: hypothetical protein PUE30_02690 [Spirochaetia bacterium]|nr:hypothetical protein [Spirochaetia bacterium]
MVKQSICVCEKPLKKPAAAGSLTLIAGQARQLKPFASGVSFFCTAVIDFIKKLVGCYIRRKGQM